MGNLLHFPTPNNNTPQSGGRTPGAGRGTFQAPALHRGSTLIGEYERALHRRRQSPQTIRLRAFYINKLERACGDLRTLTIDELEWWIEQHPDWSENTQQAAIASLRSFYKWAHQTGQIDANPAAELLRIRVHRTPSKIATDDAIRAGLARATVPDQAMILLGAECGFRVSEIAALHRDNRDGRWLTVIGKGNVQRTLAASPELEAALDVITATSMRWGFYFPGRSGGHAHPSMVWRHIRDNVGVNPHALRHRAGTVVYRKTGNDIVAAQRFLGHADSHTTEIYIHTDRDGLAAACEATRLAA